MGLTHMKLKLDVLEEIKDVEPYAADALNLCDLNDIIVAGLEARGYEVIPISTIMFREDHKIMIRKKSEVKDDPQG